ncbi:hypothetical protein CBM2600_B10629 [Cupriavidus taiwanensis]|nr:hypothetical protein CBM2600_B10629 [Cupriavidus taiwanensis]
MLSFSGHSLPTCDSYVTLELNSLGARQVV